MKSFFVFDVESVGLHGEGFAVAGGVYFENGSMRWEFCYSCPPDRAGGHLTDRVWVGTHVPAIDVTHQGVRTLREQFWREWEKAKVAGAEMAVECGWPVESRFLSDCIKDDAKRCSSAPYPLHEIASIMLAAGMDPMATYDRLPSELPKHNPLSDARQSARLLAEALAKIEGWSP